MMARVLDGSGTQDSVMLIVPDGAVYVLVGANGAGKSTLFKVLMNLERADAGTAAVFDLQLESAGASQPIDGASSTSAAL